MPNNVALYLSLTQMHHQGIANGALRYANAKGWRIFGAYWPMYEIGAIDAWNGDGIIAAVESAGELRKLRRAGVPIVDISGAIERDDLTRVSNDNVAIGRLAGDHIARLGYDRYCFAAAAGSLWSDERFRGFQEATAPYRRDDVAVFRRKYGWWQSPEFSPELARFLRRQKRPFAVMAANDIIGMNVVGACRLAGLAIPADVALVSVDNEELLCELSTPPMSSIPFDRFEIGFRAAERLDALMQGLIGYMPPLLIPPLPLVERASSTLLPSTDIMVNEALSYIRQNARQGIGAVEVVRQAKRSRRTLETRFKKIVGTSILEEIHRVRIGHASHLLLETTLPVSRISKDCGFNSVARFIAVFTEMTGASPKAYRQRKGVMVKE